jgi:hypothetical protein
MAGVASMAAAISVADRSLRLVIRFLHLDQKSQQSGSLRRWRSDRPIKGTSPHALSTPREADIQKPVRIHKLVFN